MNKKKSLLVALAVMMILSVGSAALLAYYGQTNADVQVEQAILFSGDGTTETGIVACDVVTREHSAENKSVAEIPMDISTTVTASFSPNSAEDAVTVHKGTLLLTKKTGELGPGCKLWTPTGPEIEVEYVMSDGVFDAEVVSGTVLENYELIYYKDVDEVCGPGEAYTISEVGNTALPYAGDKNLDIEYCDGVRENYATCHGAKIWYVPSGDISGNSLTWANMNDYYYEKEELIQYNNTSVVVFPGEILDFSTETTFHCQSIAGLYNIATDVVPMP